MKNKSFAKSLIFIILAIALSLALVGCDCGGNPPDPSTTPSGSATATPTPGSSYVGDNWLTKGSDGNFSALLPASYSVEFGDAFQIPQMRYADGSASGLAVTYTITDPNGTVVRDQYGMLRPTMTGNYTISLVAGDNVATGTMILTCSDTVAPNVVIQNYVGDGMVGESITVPYYTASDKAGIDNSRSNIVVYDPDGTEVAVNNGLFVLTKSGDFTVYINVYDNHGQLTTKTVTVRAALMFVDEAVANDNVLMDFDEEEYLELVFDVANRDTATREIVTSGYPAIDGEVEGNGVLAIYNPNSTPSTVEDVYTRFRLYTGFNTGEVKASALKIRFAVSTDTDYVHLMRDKAYVARYNQKGGLKAGVWYEFVIDPLKWGYYMDFTNFTIKFRDKGQTTLYIDEISWVDPEFVDQDMAENSLGDFNEEGYVDISYQNLYNDPTTSRSYCVDGTIFEHLTEGYPEANPADSTRYPGMGADGGVVKATVGYFMGGVSYMFPNVIDVNDIASLEFKLYFEDPQPRSWIFGFFDENGLHLSNTNWYTAEDEHAKAPYAGNQWTIVSFYSDVLKAHTMTGKISGFFLQAYCNEDGGTLDPNDQDTLASVVYLDDIIVNYKATEAESEYVEGSVVTKFESDASMKNVVQPTFRWNGLLGTATHERVTSEVFGVTDGVLKITSNYAQYGNFTRTVNKNNAYGDGALYIFDEPLKASDFNQVITKIAVPENNTITSITIALMSNAAYDPAYLPIKTIMSYELTPGEWMEIGYTAEEQRALAAEHGVVGISIIIKATEYSANNIVYVDQITMYDINSDTVAPTGTFEAIDLDVVEGQEIGKDYIFADLTDDKDPMPTFMLLGVVNPNGTELAITNGKFVPDVSGTYTYKVKATDYAGNLSEMYEVPVTITVSDPDDYNYLNFGPSSMAVVSDYTDNRTTHNDKPTAEGGIAIERSESKNAIIVDEEASDKFVLESTINMNTHIGGVTIDVNTGRLISEIHEIRIRVKVEANSGGNWLRVYFNNYATKKDESSVGGYLTDTWKGAYYDVVIDQAKIQTAITNGANFGTNYLETINFVSIDAMSMVKLRIDSIKISYTGDDATITYDYNGGVDEDGFDSAEEVYRNGELVDWMPTITKTGSTFLGWTKDENSYQTFDAATETVSGDMTLKAIWFDLDWYNLAEEDAQWIVQHRRVKGGWGDNDASVQAQAWADDGYGTGKMLVDGGPDAASHAWVEVALPNLTISDLSYFSIKLYSYSSTSKSVSINFNNTGAYNNGNWSGARKFTIQPGVNTITIPVEGDTNEFLTTMNFGATVSKLYILGDQNNDPTIALDGVYFIGEGSPMALYTEKFYLEQPDGSYAEATDLTNVMVGSIGANATIRSLDINGYTFDANNVNNVATGVVADDGSLVLYRYYTANPVNVTYDYNGATDGTDAVSKVVEHKFNSRLNGPALTMAGKTLVGWTLDTTTNEIFLGKVTEEITLYPVWVNSSLNAYEFADAESNVILTHYRKASDLGKSFPDATAAAWADDGFATGEMTITGNYDAVDHSYAIISLPKMATATIERLEVTFYSNANRTLIFNFNELGAWINGTAMYENHALKGKYNGLNTVVFTGADLAKYGEYVDTLYIAGYWDSEATIHLDSVRFASAEATNLASYSEEFYIQQADGTYLKDETATITKWGKAGVSVSASAPAIGGYTYNASAEGTVASGTLTSGLVLKSYYDRAQTEVTFDYNGGNIGGNTTGTATLYGGDSLSTIATPTSTAGIFAGWATDAEGTNVVTAHNGATTYYAVWFNGMDLDFGSVEAVNRVGTVLIPAGESSTEANLKAPAAAADGGVIEFTIWQNPAHANYKGMKLALPTLNLDELTSITIRYSITNSAYSGKGTNVVYMRLAPETTNATTGILFAATEVGEYVEKVITKEQLVAIANGAETINALYFQGSGYQDNRVHIDYIDIDTTQADVAAWYAANFSNYVVKHYVRDGSNAFVVALEETFERVPVGKVVEAVAKTNLAGEYDATIDGTVASGTVVAGEAIELKLYYELVEKTITYDYNGGTDGAGESSTELVQFNNGQLLSGEGITKDGYIFLGWSTTAQTTTIDLDEDGVVGGDSTFYAVWYDIDWLTFDNLAEETLADLIDGSKSHWEAPAGYDDVEGAYRYAAKQWPVVTDPNYIYGVLRMPDVVMEDLIAITITYKTNAEPFYLNVNAPAMFDHTNNVNKAKMIEMAHSAEYTTITITKAQIEALFDVDVIKALYFNVVSWSPRNLTISNVSVITYDERFPATSIDVTYDANGGAFTEGTTLTQTQVAGSAVITEQPTRLSYVFRGWATDAEGLNIVDKVTTGTLYASWYDLNALEMGMDADDLYLTVTGDRYFQSQGAGKGYYSTGAVNAWGEVPTTWTEDGYYTMFNTWQNPEHETQYCGSIIRLPALDLDKFESITIKYLIVNDTKQLDNNKTVYLVANTPKTTNSNAGIAITNEADTTFTNGSEITISKADLLATIADADDKNTIHTLYIDGYNWTAAHMMIDSIKINTTQEDIVAHYNSYAEVTTEFYLEDGTGAFVKNDALTTTVSLVKGTTYAPAAATIVGYTFDAANADNVTSVTVADGAILKFYYTLTQSEVTYNFNGGENADGDTSVTLTQYGSDKLLNGSELIRDGYKFYGWATTALEGTLVGTDEDGLVGTDTTFYAIWYDLNWLKMETSAGNSIIAEGSAGLDTVAAETGMGLTIRAWQNPAHANYTKGIIRLPHVDVDQLISMNIRINTSTNASNNQFILSVNSIPTANSTMGHLSINPTKGEWTTITLTAADFKAAYADIEYVDYIAISGINYDDRRPIIEDISIITTEPGYPVETVQVVYDFNGGENVDGDTSITVDAETGSALMDGSALTKEGYTFFGWAPTATVSNFDGMLAAGLAASEGVVSGATTYYAVWYGNDWLNFDDSTTNSLILKGSYVKTHTSDFDGDGNDETVAGGRIMQVYGWGNYTHLQVLLPRTAVADIESISIKAYCHGFNWGTLGAAATTARWYNFCLNGPADSSNANENSFSKASDGAVLNQTNSNVAALVATEQAIYGSEYLWYMDICGTQDGDIDVLLDSITITKKA